MKIAAVTSTVQVLKSSASTDCAIAAKGSSFSQQLALNVRGGGILGTTNDGLATFAAAFFLIAGLTSAAGPAEAWKPVNVDFKPDSLAFWCSEFHG